MSSFLSRRDFLKLSSLSLGGFFLPNFGPAGQFFASTRAASTRAASTRTVDAHSLNAILQPLTEQLGRVLELAVQVYTNPSTDAKKVREYWRDMVLPISEVTIGDEQPAHNRVWYRIGTEGFVHSSGIQPVRTQLNSAAAEIPEGGNLAEVTVPYTDAHYGPTKSLPVAYRLYYETTHWVTGVQRGPSGEWWYQIAEDKWESVYYAPASHLRLIPDSELSPISGEIPYKGKRLEVLTAEQAVVAYEWDRPVFVARAATGSKFSNGNFETPLGRHMTFHKRPSRHMAAGNLAFNGYDLPGVPWISYFTESGISFHGTYWHNNFGRPRSHGCINLTPKAAKWVYRWTLPGVPAGVEDVYEDSGTIVDVI